MEPTLRRRLGLSDAVFIGLGSMIGAGVFAVFAPATAAAGNGLLVALAIAAVVAFGNATSTAQLAASHPTSGGTYAYGRAELGPWWGYAAGWAFVIGKTASCAAMALTFAAYAAPQGGERPVAVLALAVVTAVNLFGITRTALMTRVIVVVVLLVLAIVVVASSTASARPAALLHGVVDAGWYGILQAAGLLFFAFAGYARVATMGEEVRDPRRTIPRAILLAFAGALLVYAVVAVTVLAALGPAATAASTEPLVDAAAVSGWEWTTPVIRAGAAAASLGALLALIAGIARTTFAMSREGDLPRALAAVHPRSHVPHRAQIAVALAAIGIVAFADLRGAIGFSSFGVLLYYFVANYAALRQAPAARRYPRPLQIIGAGGCLLLAFTLPWPSVVAGIAVIALGLIYRAVRLRLRRAV